MSTDNPKPLFFVLGPSWYGDWAKDFTDALIDAGVDAKLIYVNTLGNIELDGAHGLRGGALGFLKKLVRLLGPRVVSLAKKFLEFQAERNLIKNILHLTRESREVVVLFTWTPPRPSVLKRLDGTKARLVLWQGEAPIRNSAWTQSFGFFEKIFVFDESWVNMLPSNLRARASALPTGASSKRFFREQPDLKFSCEIAFVGLYRRERAEVLSILKDYDLRIYGYNWEQGFDSFPWLRSRFFGQATATEVNKIFNNAHISIGSFGMGIPGVAGETITQRTYEISLAGGFQIGFYVPSAIPAFDNSLVMFKNKEDLKKIVEYYLAHPEKRVEIAEKNHAIAVSRHSYLDRARTMLKALDI